MLYGIIGLIAVALGITAAIVTIINFKIWRQHEKDHQSHKGDKEHA